MTAFQVIDQIKALPEHEKEKVFNFVIGEASRNESVKYADDSKFKEAAKWTFKEHKELMNKLSK